MSPTTQDDMHVILHKAALIRLWPFTYLLLGRFVCWSVDLVLYVVYAQDHDGRPLPVELDSHEGRRMSPREVSHHEVIYTILAA